MIETLRRICELQPYYSPNNTPEMQERGRLIRDDLTNDIRALSESLAAALGRFGGDFQVEGRDGTGLKTELPWVRFFSESMSPQATEGFYCVIHFSTDGSAVHITVGCGSSQFRNGSFVTLPDSDLDKRTAWARQVVREGVGSIEPFTDPADFGARRALPISFQRATAIAKRISVNDLATVDLDGFLIRAAEYLRLIYQAESDGRELSPADQDELEIKRLIKPLSPRKGQGFGLSADDRKRVELQAMRLTKEWLENEGYRVRDTSANYPYDFEANNGDSKLKVEVKGTTSDNPDAVFMTRNEVDLHRTEKGSTAMFIVAGIRLETRGSEKIALGGELHVFVGWDIDEWHLTPTAYRVEKP